VSKAGLGRAGPRRRLGVGLVFAIALACAAAVAAATGASHVQVDGHEAATTHAALGESQLPRHPLELRALSAPVEVLRILPSRIAEAQAARDSRELALLYLAQANACRVIANWPCQRQAGALADIAARGAGQPILRARALVSESRASIAMQDFTRAEQFLGEAELLLKATPSPELSADVFLAYSSLSWSLGKQALSAEYAERGLMTLPADLAPSMRTRLLRNLARAQAQLGRARAAQVTIDEARELTSRFHDPKLSAEILVEGARMARMAGDLEAQRRAGRGVLALAGELRNSQLEGLGREVLGLAALDAGDQAEANTELDLAYRSFRALGQKRDELRVLRELLRVAIDQKRDRATVDAMARRFLEIDGEIESSDRAKAADDFDARLAYAERELDVLRLKDEAVLAAERERRLGEHNRLALWVALFALVLAVALGAFFLAQRRSNERLRRTLDLLRESEARAQQLSQALHEQSLRDALTGSFNRRQLALFESTQRERGWGAITVDLDHFKLVNDTQGHERGDQVLVDFVRFLVERVQPDDVVVRLGGDEFAVLLAGADTAALKAVAARLRRDAASAPCAFSLGSALRLPGEPLGETIARADAGMYAARAASRAAARASIDGA
jgi:diguanylate cyclase (GGDEF)-like protein